MKSSVYIKNRLQIESEKKKNQKTTTTKQNKKAVKQFMKWRNYTILPFFLESILHLLINFSINTLMAHLLIWYYSEDGVLYYCLMIEQYSGYQLASVHKWRYVCICLVTYVNFCLLVLVVHFTSIPYLIFFPLKFYICQGLYEISFLISSAAT